jgi:signal transduction histidine kinase
MSMTPWATQPQPIGSRLAPATLAAATLAPVALRRAPAPGAAARPLPRWARAALGVPLTMKLVGANLLVAAAAAVALAAASPDGGPRVDYLILGGALIAALAANTALVTLALRPVWELEATAARVWRGDFSARVPASPVADAAMARVGRTVNLLLDALDADRARLRALAAQTISAQDAERSRIARELHDSTAQTIAALTYQLAAAARDVDDPALARRLAEIRDLAGDALEEVRVLAHTIHPRVLDDLGLAAAMAWLARRTREHSGLDVEVAYAADVGADALSREAAATLYRVAQESLRNVERHAGATSARVSLTRDGDDIALDIADDGRGFDLAEAEARRPGMGLFSIRERVALVGGALHIDTAPGRGTRVRARVPGAA